MIEMSLRSFFKISTGFFFGSSITSTNFHDRGRRCPLNDASRILRTGMTIRSAYSRRSQFGILSEPTDLEGLRFDRTFHTRSSDTSRNSIGGVFFQGTVSDGARQTILFKRLKECFIYRVRQFLCT